MNVTVLSSAHDVADARLHREVASLLRAGARVEVIALGDAGSGPAGAVVASAPRRGLGRRVWRAVWWPWRASGAVLVALDPDMAVGAAVRTRIGGRRLVVDVHEDYAELLADRAWARGWRGRVARGLLGLARWAQRVADLVVAADEQVSCAVEPLILRNLPDRGQLPAPAEPGERPRALYVGDVRRSRGLFAMLQAIADAPGWTLDVVGPVAAGDADDLAELLVADPELESRVTWHGRQPPDRAWQLAPGAWVGMMLLEDTPAFRRAMPSKLYEYLACGLPVLTTALPRPAELVERTGAGRTVADAGSAAEVLRAWAADPAGHRTVVKAAVRAGQGFDASAELDRFAQQVVGLARR